MISSELCGITWRYLSSENFKIRTTLAKTGSRNLTRERSYHWSSARNLPASTWSYVGLQARKLFPRWPGHSGNGSLNSCKLLKVPCSIFYIGMVWVREDTIKNLNKFPNLLFVPIKNHSPISPPSGSIIQIDVGKFLQYWLLVHSWLRATCFHPFPGSI